MGNGFVPVLPKRFRKRPEAGINKRFGSGRADWIRTSDLLNPIQAFYQTELRPDFFEGGESDYRRLGLQA